MEKIDKDIPFSYKLKLQIADKWFVILGIAFLSVLISTYNSCTASQKSIEMSQKMAELVDKNLNSVLVATVDGRIEKVAKKPINAGLLRNYVRYVIIDRLILDASDLTNGFSLTLTSFKDLTKSYKIQALIPFLPPKSQPENRKQFIEYLKFLMTMARSGELPEYIDIIRVLEEDMKTKKNKFLYSATYELKITKTSKTTASYSTGKRVFKISIVGEFNPVEGTEMNPYGLRFLEIKKVSKIRK